MNRYQQLFLNLQKKRLGAFIPFITIGDPNPILFMNIIDTLIQSGCDALELGIPFSDPVADGPIIQKSMQRAFTAGINFSHCLTILNNIRKKYPNIPIGILIYANLIFKNNIHNFYSNCSKLNIDSILIPDVPIEESIPFHNAATKHKIAQIFICPPNATEELIQKISFQGSGYIYLLSRAGVTGLDNESNIDTTVLHYLIKKIKKYRKEIPILQGFGIYTPQQAKLALSSGASGIISGSIIAKIIETHISDHFLLLKELKKFVYSMKKSMYYSY